MSVVRCAARQLVRPFGLRAISTTTPAGVIWSDKERGEEAIAFRKEDERLLRALLAKVKKAADSTDVHEAEGSRAAELSSLKAILGKYNVSDKDLQAVLEWKHGAA
ncbi:hypothetical protein WJX72_001004 [[Myrmecia] bisecta]|uniref:Uncharacterized protein n=1 Tax=[Myrmecia] bisecta TaxID=41462 RepID=A0AAW1R4Y5_9CHLO